MKPTSNGKRLLGAGVATIAISLAFVAAHGATDDPAQEQVIKVTAKRYSYTPYQIVLKRGRPAVLEFTSLDFVHGFKVPELNIRVDLPPGQVTTVRLTPQKTGTFDFLCDNFCGAGHEE